MNYRIFDVLFVVCGFAILAYAAVPLFYPPTTKSMIWLAIHIFLFVAVGLPFAWLRKNVINPNREKRDRDRENLERMIRARREINRL